VADDLHHFGKRDEGVHDRRSIVAAHEDVDVGAGLAAAAQAAAPTLIEKT
jgi:hypothetical protein